MPFTFAFSSMASAKLAAMLKADRRKPLLVAADIYRPAAVDQLKVLGEQIGVRGERDLHARARLLPTELRGQGVRQRRLRRLLRHLLVRRDLQRALAADSRTPAGRAGPTGSYSPK